jgi:hypothetical protein
MSAGQRWQHLNLLALAIAIAVLVATGVAWWRDRVRTFETPRWEAARFVALAPEAPLDERERWVVAVSLACPHCQAHLRALAARTAPRERPPALTALIVDQPMRPTRDTLGVPLAGGVWWDSTQVWREAWGRRAYGETFRFSAKGELLSSTPAGVVPDSSTIAI